MSATAAGFARGCFLIYRNGYRGNLIIQESGHREPVEEGKKPLGQGVHWFLPGAVEGRDKAAEQYGQRVVLHGFLRRIERAAVVKGGGKEQQGCNDIKRQGQGGRSRQRNGNAHMPEKQNA